MWARKSRVARRAGSSRKPGIGVRVPGAYAPVRQSPSWLCLRDALGDAVHEFGHDVVAVEAGVFGCGMEIGDDVAVFPVDLDSDESASAGVADLLAVEAGSGDVACAVVR